MENHYSRRRDIPAPMNEWCNVGQPSPTIEVPAAEDRHIWTTISSPRIAVSGDEQTARDHTPPMLEVPADLQNQQTWFTAWHKYKTQCRIFPACTRGLGVLSLSQHSYDYAAFSFGCLALNYYDRPLLIHTRTDDQSVFVRAYSMPRHCYCRNTIRPFALL